MINTIRFTCILVLAGFINPPAFVSAHDDSVTLDSSTAVIAAAHLESGKAVSGQGKYKFKVLKTRDILPEKAIEVLEKAHGGFAVDRRPDKGQIYFALPGAGILRIENDFSQAQLLDTDESMSQTNMHNCTIWYTADGSPRLVFPGNDAGKVFTTDLDGKLLNTLDSPTAATDFDNETVNTYFKEGGKFVPTDVEYLNRLYYVTTGYSKLDYVLTARVRQRNDGTVWNDLAFGGKGSEPGQFQTGHGVMLSPDGKHIHVADRPQAEIDRFTRYGHYLGTLKLPEGSLACDIDYEAGLALVPCLDGPDKSKGAPIYILEGDQIVSSIMIKEELGLEKFTHIHNAVLIKKDGKLYVIAQAWNPGDFAVLEQVME